MERTKQTLVRSFTPGISHHRAHSGFTLIELLVVMVIIGLLGALVGPRLFRNVGKSKITAAKAQIGMFMSSLGQYKLEVGTFPDHGRGASGIAGKASVSGSVGRTVHSKRHSAWTLGAILMCTNIPVNMGTSLTSFRTAAMVVRVAKVRMKTSSVGSKESQTKAFHRLRLEISKNAACPLSQSVRILHAVHLKGFTLIEVLVVLVLLAALTAVAAPSIGRGFGAIELQTTARQVAATLRLARTRAVREQQVFLVGFDLEKNRIELMREDLSFRRTFELPESIAIHKVTRKGEAPLDDVRFTCLFVPNGLSESFEVWLRNKRGKELKVVQDSIRKSPRIEDVETDETDTGR